MRLQGSGYVLFLLGRWVHTSLPRLGSFLHASISQVRYAEEWSGDTKKMYLSGLDAQLAAPGGPTGYAHAWSEDAEPRPWNETTSMSSQWPMPQLPQHLPEAMPAPSPMRAMPASSWASPLRVPLPEPIINKYDKPLAGDEPLELPPHLSTMIEQFATVDPTPWQEEAPKRFQPPPGLAAEQSLAGPRVAKSVVPVATELDLPPGIKIFGVDYAGSMCTRVEWRIDDLNGKLQASMGRPLVSPPFAALGLPNLRLMASRPKAPPFGSLLHYLF